MSEELNEEMNGGPLMCESCRCNPCHCEERDRAKPAAERTEEGEDEGEAWEPDEFSDGPYTNLADGRMEPAADIDAPEYGDMQLWYPREEWYPLLCAWRTFAARVSALEAEKGALENQLLGSSDCIKFTQEPQ